MDSSGPDWIEALPADLPRQKELLRKLHSLCKADQRIRWLVIGCSLARSAADQLSDLDLAMGITDEDFESALPDIRHAINRLSDLVDSYHHQLPAVTGPHERIFAQYADRTQIDLMLFPATINAGEVPDVVVLYDPGKRLVITGTRQPPTPEQLRQWAFRAWCALADLGKYLRRNSLWEALERLHEARTQLWQLSAAALAVPHPQYGLTSILDHAPSQLPPLEDTLAGLNPDSLLRAARHLAAHLNDIGSHLPEHQRAALPEAMAHYITNDLQRITP